MTLLAYNLYRFVVYTSGMLAQVFVQYNVGQGYTQLLKKIKYVFFFERNTETNKYALSGVKDLLILVLRRSWEDLVTIRIFVFVNYMSSDVRVAYKIIMKSLRWLSRFSNVKTKNLNLRKSQENITIFNI